MMSPGEHRQVRVPIPFEERFFFSPVILAKQEWAASVPPTDS